MSIKALFILQAVVNAILLTVLFEVFGRIGRFTVRRVCFLINLFNISCLWALFRQSAALGKLWQVNLVFGVLGVLICLEGLNLLHLEWLLWRYEQTYGKPFEGT